MKWEWYHISEMVHIFIHLLFSANHKDSKWEGIDVKRGQMITGRKSLSRDLNFSEQTVRTCIKRLKSTNEITIKSTNKYSIITICKYDDYQIKESDTNQQNNQQFNQQLTSNQPATNQQLTTNKNEKNIKKDNNEINIYYLKSEKNLKNLLKYFNEPPRNFKITYDQLQQEAEQFILKKEVETDTMKNYAEYASHFLNLIAKKFEKKAKSSKSINDVWD